MVRGCTFQKRNVVDYVAMNSGISDDKACDTGRSQRLMEQTKYRCHLAFEIFSRVMVLLEEMRTRANLGFPNCNWVEAKPVHSVLVVEPVLVRIGIRGRRDCQIDGPDIIR